MGWKNTDIPETEWNEPEAELLVKNVVRKYGGFIIDNFPDIDSDDLVSECLIAVRAAWPRFDPAKGNTGNFISAVAWRKIIDKKATLNCWRRHEDGSSSDQPNIRSRAAESVGLDPLALAEMFYSKSKELLKEKGVALYPKNRPDQFERHFSIAHEITLFGMRERLKMSTRGMIDLLKSRPDIRQAMRLPRVPSAMFFSRSQARVTRLRLVSRNRRPAAELDGGVAE